MQSKLAFISDLPVEFSLSQHQQCSEAREVILIGAFESCS